MGSRAIAIVACGVLVLSQIGTAQKRFAISDESSSRRTLRFAGAAADRVLDVRLFNGSIRVIATNGAEVELELRKRVSLTSMADLQAAERDVTLEFFDNASRVGLVVQDGDRQVCGEPSDGRRNNWHSRGYEVSFDLTVRVPRDARLELCAINGGEIRLEQTMGDFEISHVNGPIALQDVGGSGSAETINGDVRATFAVAPRTASRLKTLNGDIDAAFSAGLAADLRLKTFNGGLFTDFDVVALARTPPPGERRNGMFVYQSNVHTAVRVGRGGPEMTFETFNGDVRIRRATR